MKNNKDEQLFLHKPIEPNFFTNIFNEICHAQVLQAIYDLWIKNNIPLNLSNARRICDYGEKDNNPITCLIWASKYLSEEGLLEDAILLNRLSKNNSMTEEIQNIAKKARKRLLKRHPKIGDQNLSSSHFSKQGHFSKNTL